MNPVELLLARLPDAKPTGTDRWRCACPAHSGKNRSTLSVRVADDGRILLHCFAGCSVDQIVAALGLDMGDLFPPKPGRAGAGASPLKRRRMLSPQQALDLLERETLVIYVTASDLYSSRTIIDDSWARLKVAAARVLELAAEAQS